MFYREAGQFKSTYAADMAVFPIRQDRIGLAIILADRLRRDPLFRGRLLHHLGDDSLPRLLDGGDRAEHPHRLYTGLISLGTAAFMGVGAYACYKLTTVFPDVNIIVLILASGLFSAAIGVLFGLPSLRIKGFYLAVATLAAQFFLQWAFVRVPWLYNYNASGAIEVPQRLVFGVPVTGALAAPETRYFVLPRPRRGPDLVRLQPGPWQDRALLDGGARHGHRRRADGHQACSTPSCSPSRSRPSMPASPGAMYDLPLVWRRRSGRCVLDPPLVQLILFMVIIGGLGSLIGSFLRRRSSSSILPTDR